MTKCANEEDPISKERWDEIPLKYKVAFSVKNSQVKHCFDIRSLTLNISFRNLKNPLTQQKWSHEDIVSIYNILSSGRIKKMQGKVEAIEILKKEIKIKELKDLYEKLQKEYDSLMKKKKKRSAHQ